MKQKIAAWAVLAALSTGLCAYAASAEGTPETVVAEQQPATVAAAPEAAEPASETTAPAVPEAAAAAPEQQAETKNAPVTVQTGSGMRQLAFDEVDGAVRAGNVTVLANAETLKNVENMDADDVAFAYDMQKDAMRQAVSAMQNLYQSLQSVAFADPDAPSSEALKAVVLGLIQSNIMTNEASIAGIDAQIKDIEDKGDDYFNKPSIRRQLAYAEDATVSGVETLYITVAVQKMNLASGQRSLAALDRTITEMEKRHELGQVSDLQLEQLQSQRASVASQLQTLAFAINNLETDIGVQLGWDIGTGAEVSALPVVSDYQLRGMDYENDLSLALDNSFTIWQAQQDVTDAENDYSEASSLNSKHAIEAAKLSLQSSERSVVQSFRKLSLTVTEKKRLVDVAQSALTVEEKTFAAAKTRYDRGMISKNTLDTAQDTLDTARDAVTSAQYELFTAYRQYIWATRGVLSAQ